MIIWFIIGFLAGFIIGGLIDIYGYIKLVIRR